MVASVLPIYGLGPVVGSVEISTANAALDGTGALGLLKTGGVNGSRIDYIVVKASVSTLAGLVRVFVDDGIGIRLRDEIQIANVSATPTVRTVRAILSCAIALPVGYKLWVSTSQNAAFEVYAHGADY